MIEWLKKLFNDKDGDADEMATCVILLTVAFIGHSAYAVVANHQPFDLQAFGIGGGALIGAAATGMGIKSKQENKP